ncbi:MAG: Crp/Fnr family transcriptional regulator [Fimbriimonadaceae bacterium]|nr:Crp/Fnr family transcriptional regulator [Fimbriimonadaceae bacterium]
MKRAVPDGEPDMADFPERPTNIGVLRSSTLLNSLSEEQMMEVAGISHMAFAERAETIWLNGTTVDFFGVVGCGFVKMTRSTSHGQDVTTEVMGPGQVFGLLGVIDGMGCPQTARAICPTWYLKVPKRGFLPVYHQNVILKESLVRRTTTRLRSAYEMMARMSTGKVEERVAVILLILVESYGRQTAKGSLIQVPLTRQDIAEMAGTTVESTIRTISKWQKAGWVSVASRRFTILDMDAIEAFL